jgi:peptidoglycan LD-endopeptidase CwlK
MYKFSNKSKERLNTCHEDLRLIANIAIKRSQIDFGIAEGHRSVERQYDLYKAGLSKIDGVNKRGKHNYKPSLAFDIYAWVNGRSSYDQRYIIFIAGVILAVAKELKEQGRIETELRWGGNWDGDGQIINDQSFNDLVHFEIKT